MAAALTCEKRIVIIFVINPTDDDEPMILDSDLLRTFVAVSETGNFTQAAGIVGRTQSAVSMQMKRLEEMVGATLFERGPRGVALTRPGSELLTNARRIVSLLDETAAALREPPLDGPVRIGLPEEYGSSVLARALGAFAKRHPNVEVTVRYGRSDANLESLAGNELDLAVVFDARPTPEGEVMMTDPTVWVTSDLHGVHTRLPVPVALYTQPSWCMDLAIQSLQRRRIPYRVAYTSSTSSGLKIAVSSGLAVAPISRSNIPADCRELTAADGFGEIDASRVVMHRGRRATGAAVDSMAAAIRDAFRTIHG